MAEKSSTYLSVLNTWPEYFDNLDEGLGTTYERFILHRYFELIRDQFEINSVLEAPSFGMTGVSGINSLWWSREGVRPVVVDNHQERIEKTREVWNSIPLPVELHYTDNFKELAFGNKSFDLSWNFASLWFVADVEAFLAELDRVTQKVIFICVPNKNGLGFRLRSLFNKDLPEDFYPKNIYPRVIKNYFKKSSWTLWKSGYLDIPPWPDIAMKKEDMLAKVGLGFLVRNKHEDTEGTRTCIVDYFNGERPELEAQILKYDFLEKMPFPIKQLWGHHRYFIYCKG